MSGVIVGSEDATRTVPRLRGRRKYEFSVAPNPGRSDAMPGSDLAAGRKWNCRSGVVSSVLA